MTGRAVAAALRYEVVAAGRALQESLGFEGVRKVPLAGVVVLPVQVEQDQGARRDRLAPPLQVGDGPPADERGERVEATHLVGERHRVFGIGLGQPFP